MRNWLLTLLLFPVGAPAQTTPLSPAAMEATPCRPLVQTTTNQNPVLLLESMVACQKGGRLDDAATQLLFSRVLLAFDAARAPKVADRAMEVYGGHLRDAMLVMGRSAADKITVRADELMHDPDYRSAFCGQLAGISPPAYDPTYLSAGVPGDIDPPDVYSPDFLWITQQQQICPTNAVMEPGYEDLE